MGARDSLKRHGEEGWVKYCNNVYPKTRLWLSVVKLEYLGIWSFDRTLPFVSSHV